MALFLLALSPEGRAESERILLFDVSASVAEDASLTVTESIVFHAEGRDIRRGLVRVFPTDFTDAEGRRRRAGFEMLSAKLDGRDVPFQLERQGGDVDIRLGRPDVYLEKGEHRIDLTYRATGLLSFFPDHDELYWNVTGHDWAFVIEQARFRIHLPGRDFGEGFSDISSYIGRAGDRGQSAKRLEDGSVETIEALEPGEAFTVAYSWPKGVVSSVVEAPVIQKWTVSPWRKAHLGLPPILLGLMMIFWYCWGRDPKPQTVIPRFAPPPAVEAAFARHVRSMAMDDQVLAAMILELAVKGAVVIEERSLSSGTDGAERLQGGALRLLSSMVGPSYRLSLNRDVLQTLCLSEGEQAVVTGLFGSSRNEIELGGADRSLFRETFRNLSRSYRDRSKGLFSTHIGLWTLGAGLYEGYALLQVVLLFLGGGTRFEPLFALLAGPFLIVPFAFDLPHGKGRWLTFLFLRILLPGFLLLATAVVVVSGSESGFDVDPLSLAALLAAALTLVVFRPLLKTRTVQGARLVEEIEGLRLYLVTAERSRLEQFHPPQETPRLFEALLPYALALDAAETWANRFSDILSHSDYEPSWYRGRRGRFVSLGGTSAFASAFTGACSSTLGASGSGGRGRAGGGRGGGGGRGW